MRKPNFPPLLLFTVLTAFGIIALLDWGYPAVVQADDIHVTANVDNTEITLEDTLRLIVTVHGSRRAPHPELPALPDFQVRTGGTSTSMQMINGNVSQTVSFTFFLIPLRLGTFTLGPINMEIEGNPYVTSPITVQVREQTRSPETQSLVFAEAEVSNLKPYVHEQITYTLRLFYRAEVRNLTLDQGYDPLIKENLEEPRSYSRVINGIKYQVHEMSVALFAGKPGSVTIPSALLGVDIVHRDRKGKRFQKLDPFFTDPYFSNIVKTEHKNLRTKPITLQIQPLPTQGRPENFSNLVGQFSLSAQVSRESIEAGNTTTLTLTVSGSGNPQAISLPTPDFGPSLKVYNDQPEYKQNVAHGKINGTKVYKFALVPLKEGSLTLPPVSQSYFDPETGAYRTMQSAPISLTILPGSGDAPLEMTKGNSLSTEPGVPVLAKDILPIHTRPDALEDTQMTPGMMWGYGSSLVLPPILFLLFFYRTRYQHRMATDVAFSRKRKAFGLAQSRLREAASKNDLSGIVPEISLAVREYIGNILNLQGTAFTPLEMEALLREREFPQETVSSVITLLERLEALQYANPHGESSADLIQTSNDLLEHLERLA